CRIRAIDKNFFEKSEGDIRALIVNFDVVDLVRIVLNDDEIREEPYVDDIKKLKNFQILGDAFEDNVRVYLKQRTKINRSIKETVLSEENYRFFYYNNGITMTCDKFEYPNLIKNVVASQINQIWHADITYIRILASFVYLAAIIDEYSRKIVGYGLGRTLSADLPLAALTYAIEKRKPGSNLIHHSDQGIQYCSYGYIKVLEKYSIAISMSSKANPYDNAKIESFFRSLKVEEVYMFEYETYTEVLERIPYFIEEV
ncbi:unnamed protein product, partial [marine sediment metagenome]